MSLSRGPISVLVSCACLAAGFFGCLSDDTSLPPAKETPSFDAGPLPGFDAGMQEIDATAPMVDAASDSGPAPDAGRPVDAGGEAGKSAPPTQAGLVVGGTVAHSPNFKMTATTGPASAPVLKSPRYQIVGGMTVAGPKP